MPAFTLTSEQQAIVAAPVGHYVIRAVAGSGKTTTLTYRIQSLLAQGLDPRRVLVLMFNKSAQMDFQGKLKRLSTDNSPVPEVRTFHAMGFRLYKRFIQLGALPQYHGNIISEREIQFHLLQLMPQVLSPDQQSEFKRYKKEYLDVAARFIDQCKSQLDDARSFFRTCKLETKFSFLPALFDRFEEWRKDNARISYADMLYDPVCAILADQNLRTHVENKIDVILVDEYQDTNDIQHELLNIISGTRAKVTIVGDPDQTIYEFRGAKPQYMLSGFAQDHAECQALNLSTSFRYGHQVALLANQLIAHSPYHDDALCIPNESNPHTHVDVCETKDELQSLSARLNKLDPETRNNTAILVRYWSQSASIELALLRANIAYQLSGYRGIFGSEEMFALRALLQLASGQFGALSPQQREQALMQLARFPHVGVNERQVQTIMHQLAQCSSRWGHHVLAFIPNELSRFQKLKLERFAKGLSVAENNTNTPRAIFKQFAGETKLFDDLRNGGLSQDASDEQVRTVKNLMLFMAESGAENATQLITELTALEERTHARQQDQHRGIHLTSIHRAKGLEWDHVVLPGLSENVYFSSSSRKDLSAADIASERRLIYVAMTRAKQSLLMLTPPTSDPESLRFIDEMQILSSRRLTKAIEEGKLEADVGHEASDMLQRYAAHFKITLPKSKATIPDTRSNGKPIWRQKKVTHKVLGNGRVVLDEAETFTVEFDDLERRVFSKRYAEKIFETA